MYRFAKAALNLRGQAISQVRHKVSTSEEFHRKYGTGVLVGGTVFCTAVWAYVVTMLDITWNVSPVGRIMPKEWRESEE